ncbi:MAG: DUF296 domain-containing protein [Armatimonadetes bacterium]|nr:DUF296 domain-containing protein [Armatimonadota bacterium]
MQFQRFGQHYVLRLMPDEEAMTVLKEFVRREEIRGGYFIAFGAFRRVKLQYFDIEKRKYLDNAVDRQVEVVSLMGNIAQAGNGETKLHIHGAVADSEMKTYSGHLDEGIVRPTLEVFLTRLDGELLREKDPETGLDLLSLPQTL